VETAWRRRGDHAESPSTPRSGYVGCLNTAYLTGATCEHRDSQRTSKAQDPEYARNDLGRKRVAVTTAWQVANFDNSGRRPPER
jgi:hypothetical protein